MEEFTQRKAFLYKVLVIEFSFFVKGVGWDRTIESVFTFPPPAFRVTNYVGHPESGWRECEQTCPKSTLTTTQIVTRSFELTSMALNLAQVIGPFYWFCNQRVLLNSYLLLLLLLFFVSIKPVWYLSNYYFSAVCR